MGNSKITKDHPKYAEYTKFREAFNERIANSVDTWGDFERVLKVNLDAYFDAPGVETAHATVSLFYAALVALLENPEEGDIKKIVARIGDLLVFRPDICGSDALELVASLEAKRASALLLLSTLGDILSGKEEGAEAPPEDKPTNLYH